MNQTDFFEALDRLSSGERAVLRRASGQLIQEADAQSMAVFYRCLPWNAHENYFDEERWFASACFHCLWEAESGPRQPLEQVMKEMRKKSDSMEHRLTSLLDMSWETDGYLLTKLSRIVKMARQQGYCVDCDSLLEDLLHWNSDTQYVQRKWARAMYYDKEKEDINAV